MSGVLCVTWSSLRFRFVASRGIRVAIAATVFPYGNVYIARFQITQQLIAVRAASLLESDAAHGIDAETRDQEQQPHQGGLRLSQGRHDHHAAGAQDENDGCEGIARHPVG